MKIQVGDNVKLRNGKVGRVARIKTLVYVEVPTTQGKTEIIGAMPNDVKKIRPPKGPLPPTNT